MKKSLILMALLWIGVVAAGCSISANQVDAAAGGVVEATPNIIYVTATEETPNIIYVTATAEPQNADALVSPSIFDGTLSGKIVYSKLINRDPLDMQIFMMDLANGVERQLTFDGINSQAMWSPDGSKILYASASQGKPYDIYIMDENGENAHAVVTTSGVDGNAVWSPEGNMLAYNSDVDGNTEVYTIHLETNEIRQITNDDSGYHGAPSWSPDGKKIVYVYGDGVQFGTKLFMYDFVSGSSQEIDGDKFYMDDLPVWSPDGQSILFSRNNGTFKRIIRYDLTQMQESLLTENVFPEGNMEYQPEKSARGNFVSFSENGKFYVMDMNQQLIYPLGIEAADLNYFPE